jgi:preprotein translocase subunit SecE
MLNFDTLEFYKELVHAGIKEQAAEVIVKGFEESRKIDMSHLATKQDMEDIRRDIEAARLASRQDLKDFVNEIRNEIKEVSFKVNLIYKASAVILVSVIIPLVLKAFDYLVPRLVH